MARRSNSSRERVLDAFEALLRDRGERAATLDAVAAAAGVSKGGLLYHFRSKRALVGGLLERFDALSEGELEKYRTDPRGVVETFLRLSLTIDERFDRTFFAVMALSQSGRYPDTRVALEATISGWYNVIHEDIGDPTVARIVQVLGDGLYYGSVFEGVPRVTDAEMDNILEAIFGMLRRSSG
ncbi:TetR/AcrR family transcriptional regulator [Okibacterium endophyticum]